MNIWDLNDQDLKKAAKLLRSENRSHPEQMTRLLDATAKAGPVGRVAMARDENKLIEVWRSRYYLCQIYEAKNGIERLSICRPEVDTTNRRWRDGLTWDELMLVKKEVGRGEKWAVEVLPAESDIVNVANMRHVFCLNEAPVFAWKKAGA